MCREAELVEQRSRGTGKPGGATMHGSSLTRSGLSEIILCGVGTYTGQELDPLLIPMDTSGLVSD